MIDRSKKYNQYAEDVVTGKIVSCQAIKLSCQRFLNWYDRTDIYFDTEDVDRKIRFISKMKHSTGQHNGKPFVLLGWQSWVIANIFGWKYNDTGLRVINNVFIMISRKAGKTAFASAIALCCAVADDEPNAEVELVANNRQQAHIAFDMCNNFSESLDPKKKIFKRYRDKIKIPRTKSSIQVLSSDAMGNDGYNSSCFILDELHASKDWSLYNVMKSSQGMRQQPLSIVITTAGFLLNGFPCYDYRQTCLEILKGIKEDDTQFSAIYELDEGDDWQNEDVWLKCSPSLNQTVSVKYLKDQVRSAINNPSQETGIKTKNFNMFCQSKEVWIKDTFIQDSTHNVDLKEFQNEICYGGVDLSSVSDLTCTAFMFLPNPEREKFPDKFVFKVFPYLPESALTDSMNNQLYNDWHRNKHLILTTGNVVDYDYILKDQIDVMNQVMLQKLGYDSWNATSWAINAQSEGVPIEPFSQSIGNFNKAVKTFEILLKQNKVVIDNNPVIRWSFQNVQLKYDYHDNCKPVKSNGDNNRKIDPVIAMLQALGTYLYEPYADTEIMNLNI